MQLKKEHQVEIHHLKCYTWLVRKQLNWRGDWEYAIEIKELDGCISYGDTYREAKEGLAEAASLWLKFHGLLTLPINVGKKPLLVIEPKMTEAEFQQVNYIIKQWKE